MSKFLKRYKVGVVMEKEFDELVKIDEELKNNENTAVKKQPVVRPLQRMPLDFFDPNYKPPDYHTLEDVELFKV